MRCRRWRPDSGSNCDPARFSAKEHRGAGAADAVGHLGELADLGQSRRDRDGVATKASRASPCRPTARRRRRPPPARPRADRAARRAARAKAECWAIMLFRSRWPGDGELDTDAETVQRRVPAAEQPHHGQGATQAPELVVVLVGLERDVVAEPLGLLVGVGMTADVDQQRRVVDDRPLVLAEPDAFRPGATRSCIGAARAPSAGRTRDRPRATGRPRVQPGEPDRVRGCLPRSRNGR